MILYENNGWLHYYLEKDNTSTDSATIHQHILIQRSRDRISNTT